MNRSLGPVAAALLALFLAPAAMAPALAGAEGSPTTPDVVDGSKSGGWMFNRTRASHKATPTAAAASTSDGQTPAASPAPASAAPASAAPASAAPAGTTAAAPAPAAAAVGPHPNAEIAALAAKDDAALAAATASPELTSQMKALIEAIRKSPIAAQPNVRDYLDLAENGKLTAGQANDFAAFLGSRALSKQAIEFQKIAVNKEPANPLLWLNLGTLYRGIGKNSEALSAYRKASRLDPGYAMAYYNIGATYDALGDYDQAIAGYRAALAIDPSLADPRKNPQVVNNEKLLAVSLMLYRERAGALGLPLVQTTGKGDKPK